MKLMASHSLVLLLAVVINVFGTAPVAAFNLAGRATDESVCDFSPETTHRLSQRKAFVPAGTQNEAMIYARLVVRTAAQECKNGQLLILHSDMGLSLDASYFPQAANRLCTVADIQRREVGTTDYPKAFEVRCMITKLDAAKEYITKLESEQTTEALIIAGQPQRSAQPSKPIDLMCLLGKRMGSTVFCGNESAQAPAREELKTDKPCWAATMTTTGCR